MRYGDTDRRFAYLAISLCQEILEIGRYRAQMHPSHVHCSREKMNSLTQTHIGRHAIVQQTMQNGNNYLNGHLMPPEAPQIHGQSVTGVAIGKCNMPSQDDFRLHH